MQIPSREITLLFYGTILFWLLVVAIIWLLGRRWERVRLFRERMWQGRVPALIITVVYSISVLLSGRGLNPYAIVIFCQVLIGLALARSIPEFEPIPVMESLLRRDRVSNELFLWIVLGLAAGLTGMFFGAAAMSIGQSLFRETPFTEELMRDFSVDKFKAFFLFLAGGGIAEEATARLFLLSLVWAVTKRPGLAIDLGLGSVSQRLSPDAAQFTLRKLHSVSDVAAALWIGHGSLMGLCFHKARV
ncbi:MAG TPA: hypothetical protein VK900_15000 [Anaerolineales bacterium]|nr:hypothetical protein [Anaerolineales bacterium]